MKNYKPHILTEIAILAWLALGAVTSMALVLFMFWWLFAALT